MRNEQSPCLATDNKIHTLPTAGERETRERKRALKVYATGWMDMAVEISYDMDVQCGEGTE